MCGIFGVIAKQDSFNTEIVSDLFLLSQSRGKDASGIAIVNGDKILVFKKATAAEKLVQLPAYRKLIKEVSQSKDTIALIGHARMVTNGTMAENNNNQPVIKDGIVAIHNGIVVNDEVLWKKFKQLKRNYEVDTEVFLALVRYFYKQAKDIREAMRKVYAEIEGATTTALFFHDLNYLALSTNTGSLYYLVNRQKRLFIFASEEYFLKELAENNNDSIKNHKITQLKPGNGLLVNLKDISSELFPLTGNYKPNKVPQSTIIHRTIENLHIDSGIENPFKMPTAKQKIAAQNILHVSYQQTKERVARLTRCTKCILPETIPFISFDKHGVCNYCLNYQKMQIKGHKTLESVVKRYRRSNGKPDCIVAFSGGRDSSFGLQYIKNELGMRPVAYSYDWGMLTDLGRRNQYRMTGSLGVEHILISADIQKKRENIKKNVEAWLQQPDLGTVPLFMAGDKQYFYYANKLKQRMGIKLVFLCENPLERTDFKSGFCGIKPASIEGKRFYALSLANTFKLASYYGKQYLTNPAYINSSLIDTLGAFISYYFIPHNYISLYSYIRWEEKTVEKTLKKYNWEVAKDTPTTWRIGDGTAALYNFTYYTMAGLSENDTFRSHQIREGAISRTEALRIANADNAPRYDSIEWYCATVGIDIQKTIKTIATAPKLHALTKS